MNSSRSPNLRCESASLFLQQGELGSAWEAAEAGIRDLGNDASRSDFWQFRFILAQVLSIRGQVGEALSYLESIGSPSTEDAGSTINLFMHRGYLQAMLGRHAASLVLLSTAETLASSSHLLGLGGEVRVRQAMVAFMQGNYVTSQRLYQSVVDVQGDKYGKYLHCVALAGVGKALMAQRQYQDAIFWLGRSVDLSTSEGFHLLRSGVMGEVGVCYLGVGDVEQSLAVHLETEKLLSRIGARRFYPVNLSNIGNVYFHKGDYAAAISYYGRALTIAKEIDLAPVIEKCSFNMLLAYAELVKSTGDPAHTG